mmetsp:Transcript_13133/g.42798  ORF Transcript_13133/g.42798 Transcript_13133/m.42798 type:complete len:277 (+) Transcript_13133:323-1153(+)
MRGGLRQGAGTRRPVRRGPVQLRREATKPLAAPGDGGPRGHLARRPRGGLRGAGLGEADAPDAPADAGERRRHRTLRPRFPPAVFPRIPPHHPRRVAPGRHRRTGHQLLLAPLPQKTRAAEGRSSSNSNQKTATTTTEKGRWSWWLVVVVEKWRPHLLLILGKKGFPFRGFLPGFLPGWFGWEAAGDYAEEEIAWLLHHGMNKKIFSSRRRRTYGGTPKKGWMDGWVDRVVVRSFVRSFDRSPGGMVWKGEKLAPGRIGVGSHGLEELVFGGGDGL